MSVRVLRAAAGTGKTWRLALEYLRLAVEIGRLGGAPADCGGILVITFTRKATAEIRERILAHLAALEGAHATDLEDGLRSVGVQLTTGDREFLRTARRILLRQPHRFRVSTIDGFTGRIFSEFVAPGLGLTDWALETTTPDSLYRDALGLLLHSKEAYARFGLVFERYVSHGRELDRYIGLMRNLVEQRWLVRLMHAEFNNGARLPLPTDEQRLLATYRGRMLALCDTLAQHGDPRAALMANPGGRALAALLSADAPHAAGLTDGFLRQHRTDLGKPFKDKPLKDAGLGKDYYAEEVYPALLGSAAAAVHDELPMLLEVAEGFYAAYDLLRKQSGRLSHADVTQYAWEALREPAVAGPCYEALSRETRFVLIDEFQDTSVVQFQLLRPLLDELTGGRGSRDWGGFVVVGDEKQAIYGWRGGERELLSNLPAIYRQRTDMLDEDTLDVNYRSQKAVNDFVNIVFDEYTGLAARMAAGGCPWPYRPVTTARSDAPGYVEVRFAEEKTCGPEDFVRSIFLPAWQRGELHGSVCILAGRHGELMAISAALGAAGVAHSHQRRGVLTRHPAVQGLLYLLRYVNRLDVLDLLRFLRSDLVGLGSADFKDLALAWRDGDHTRTPNLLRRLAATPALRELGERVERWCGLTSPVTLLQTALRELGAPQVITTDADWRAIQALVQAAWDFEAEDAPSVNGFLLWLREREERDELPPPPLDAAAGPVLMTIHQSKGLGFDHVLYYADFAQRPAPVRDMQTHTPARFDAAYDHPADWLLYAGVHRAALERIRRGDVPGCITLAALLNDAVRREQADDFNAFYVALTRAGESLRVYARTPVKRDTWSKYTLEHDGFKVVYRWLRELLGDAEAWRLGEPRVMPQEQPQTVQAPNLTRFFSSDAPAPEDTSADWMRESFRAHAPMRGEAAHDWLAWAQRSGEEADRRLRTKWGAHFTTAELSALSNALRRYVKDNELFGPRWSRVFTELPLYDADGRVWRIDRLLVDDTTHLVLIVDFKTGRVRERWQEDKYRELVNSLPWVQAGGYVIEFRYETLNLGE